MTLADPVNMVMANHSLHHILEMEQVFAQAKRALTEGGLFVTNDMIGRNGHMRWPEAGAIVSALCPLLSSKRRYHAQLRRLTDTFQDHDCSTEGFEGIRAQDILPLLLQNFHPFKFLGVGGFIDVFIDRGYGHAYDPDKADDLAFIRALADLNETLLDTGAIKPTIMFAWFANELSPERFYRNRSAQNCVREP